MEFETELNCGGNEFFNGLLVDRGLQDELKVTASAIIDGGSRRQAPLDRPPPYSRSNPRRAAPASAQRSARPWTAHRPSAEGEHVSGVCRQRVTLSSGRFAMVEDGMGF